MIEHIKNTSSNPYKRNITHQIVNSNPSSVILTLKSPVLDFSQDVHWWTDLRNVVQTTKDDLDMEKKRNNELADLLHEKTKQCAKVQVADLVFPGGFTVDVVR